MGPGLGLAHPVAVVVFLPAQRDAAHPGSEAAGEGVERGLVAAGRDDAAGAHRRDGDREPGAAEVPGGPAEQHGLAGLQPGASSPP
jgi:hypothetical protein